MFQGKVSIEKPKGEGIKPEKGNSEEKT